MMNKFYILIAMIAMVLFFTSCVSVNLADKKVVAASHVKFIPPQSPFKESNNEQTDKYWLNTKNGNSISYSSACNETVDSTLEALQSSTLSSIQEFEIIKSEKINFNDREALESEVKGKVDGVGIKLKLLMFKKNYCNYTLSYITLSKNYAQDIKQFESFVKSFEAP